MSEITNSGKMTVRWLELVFAPLMVVLIIALATCSIQAQEDMVVLQGKVSTMIQVDVSRNADIQAIKNSQQSTDVKVGKIEQNQENFRDQITEIKQQNTQILRILQE